MSYSLKIPMALGIVTFAMCLEAEEGSSQTVTSTASLSTSFEETVVTGTRTEHAILEAPVKVEVVNQKKLEEQHAFNLEDGLKTLPGIQLKPINRKFGTETVIQGIGANRILVLIDGEPTSPTTGSSIDLTQISASNVEQIEVVKGASSALYGSQALGGVINVITAKPKAGWHGTMRGDVGSFGKRNTGLEQGSEPSSSSHKAQIARTRLASTLSFANDDFYLKADGNFRSSDGYQIDSSSQTIEGPIGERNNASLLLGLTPTDASEYTIRLETYDQDLYTQSKTPAVLNPIRRLDDASRNRLALKADWQIGQGTLTLQGFTEEYETHSKGQGFDRTTEMPMTQLNMQWSQQVSDTYTSTSGIQFYQESLTSLKSDGTIELIDLENPSDNKKQSRSNVEGFFQDEWLLGPVNLVYGLRLQNDSDFGFHASPKLNVKYDFSDNWFLRYGLGTGYRVSNLKERYYVLDHSAIQSNFGYYVYGNTDLDPEQSISNQLSFVYVSDDDLVFDISFFRNDLKDLIEVKQYDTYRLPPREIILRRYENIDKAYTQGVELSLQSVFFEVLKLQGGYTFLDTEDKQTKRELDDRPEHQLKASINYLTEWGMDIGFILNWQSKAYSELGRETGTYGESEAWEQLDFRLNQAIALPGQQDLSWYLGIDNLTDQIRNFASAYDNKPSVGRVVYTGLHYKF